MRKHLKYIFFITLFFALFQLSAFANSPLKGIDIRACDDDAEWPPYTYLIRDAKDKPTSVITGLTIDVATQILTKQGAIFKPELLPWARCVDQVKKGLFQFALNASYNPERAKEFLLSEPIYATTSAYFYYAQFHPNGLDINSISDFKKYKVCGLFGYNYSSYGLDNNSPNLDTHAKFYSQIKNKLHEKVCDLFLEKIEVVQGQDQLGQHLIGNKVKWKKVPNDPQIGFSFMLSRKWDKSNELLKILNNGITEMKKNGEMKRLLEKYKISN